MSFLTFQQVRTYAKSRFFFQKELHLRNLDAFGFFSSTAVWVPPLRITSLPDGVFTSLLKILAPCTEACLDPIQQG